MQRNKFLDDLGIPVRKYGTNFTDESDPREGEWKEQREIYGFDSRECWDLKITFIEWMYSHMMMYKNEASGAINLDYHKFEFKEKTYTQREAIEFIIEKLKAFLVRDEVLDKILDTSTQIKVEEKLYDDVRDAIRMFAEIFGAMWW